MKEETIKKVQEQIGKNFSYDINESGDFRDTWRIFRIMSEFVEGYEFLSSLNKEVTVFGSARFKQGEKYYDIAVQLGALLAKNGYTTITGGGPGIMEAANKGAFEAGGESLGLNIQLPFEQRINPYVKKSMAFYYFFTRKVMMTAPAHAYIFFPGGFGTMDEFFEVIDNMELGKLCRLPIVLVGKDYWQPILDFLLDTCCSVGSINGEQVKHWYLVDTAKEAMDVITEWNHDEEAFKACELSSLGFHGNMHNMDWRIFRIMAELVEGFEFLTGLVEGVSVLGTYSIKSNSQYYDEAYQLGQALAVEKFVTVTGGSDGIAEAANKGAFEAGGESVGIGMEVHGRSKMNSYVNKSIIFKFPFTRKLIITAPSKAFVFFPGGFGTMHQLFELLTLIETKKIAKIPILLYDRKFWEPLDKFIKQIFDKKFETINDDDTLSYQIIDDVKTLVSTVKQFRNGV